MDLHGNSCKEKQDFWMTPQAGEKKMIYKISKISAQRGEQKKQDYWMTPQAGGRKPLAGD